MPTLICILGVQKDTLGSLGLSPRLAASASPFLWSCIHAQSEVEVQLCRPVFHLLSAPSGEEHQFLIYCAGCLEASEKHTSSPCCLSSALGPSSLFLCPLFTSITSIFLLFMRILSLGRLQGSQHCTGIGDLFIIVFYPVIFRTAGLFIRLENAHFVYYPHQLTGRHMLSWEPVR